MSSAAVTDEQANGMARLEGHANGEVVRRGQRSELHVGACKQTERTDCEVVGANACQGQSRVAMDRNTDR